MLPGRPRTSSRQPTGTTSSSREVSGTWLWIPWRSRPARPSGCWPRCCSPTSSGPPNESGRSATSGGGSCSTAMTRRPTGWSRTMLADCGLKRAGGGLGRTAETSTREAPETARPVTLLLGSRPGPGPVAGRGGGCRRRRCALRGWVRRRRAGAPSSGRGTRRLGCRFASGPLSNRPCGSPAGGVPTSFTGRHAQSHTTPFR